MELDKSVDWMEYHVRFIEDHSKWFGLSKKQRYLQQSDFL